MPMMEVQAIAAPRLNSRATVNSRPVSGASLTPLGSRADKWAQNGGDSAGIVVGRRVEIRDRALHRPGQPAGILRAEFENRFHLQFTGHVDDDPHAVVQFVGDWSNVFARSRNAEIIPLDSVIE